MSCTKLTTPSLKSPVYASFLFILLCFFMGCSAVKEEYSVALDPSWAPLFLEGKEKQITAFSTELLQQVGNREDIIFKKFTVSWDQLLTGLQEKKYDAILSSVQPYAFNAKLYDFSNIYLSTGPVLIVPITSTVTSLTELSGKQVAVQPQIKDTLILEKYEGILIRNYSSVPQALNALERGDVDAALVDVLLAKAYIRDLYHGKLKIVSSPMDTEGLRLLTRHGEHPKLIAAFNRGLKALQKQEKLDDIEKKWGL